MKAAKQDYMGASEVRGIMSTAGSMAKTLNSADLHSDGVIDRESRSKHSYTDSNKAANKGKIDRAMTRKQSQASKVQTPLE